MKKEKSCLGHANGFRHLDDPLDGWEEEFDIGFKFKFDDRTDEFVFQPSSQTRAYAEPRLILYISAANRAQGSTRQTLNYGLGRPEFSGGLEPNKQDEVELRRRAIPVLKLDLQALKAGRQPKSSQGLMML